MVSIGNLDRFADFMLFSVDYVDNVGKYIVDVNFKNFIFFPGSKRKTYCPLQRDLR